MNEILCAYRKFKLSFEYLGEKRLDVDIKNFGVQNVSQFYINLV